MMRYVGLRVGVIGAMLAAAFLFALPLRASTQSDFVSRMKNVVDAWQTMDPAKAAPYYDKNPSEVFFDISPAKYTGWTSYAVGAAEAFKDYSKFDLTMNDDAWVSKVGDAAMTAVTGKANITRKDGTTQAFDWRWSAFWEKKGKDWVICQEHFSVPVPETALPGASLK